MSPSTLPANVSYGLVTGRFLAAVADTSDLDRYPDGEAIKGSVVFTPQLDPLAPYLLNPTANPAPAILFPKPQTATLDDSGYLCGPDGARGIELVATDDDDNLPLDWTYKVEYRFQNLTVPSFSILVPGNVTTDLTQVARVPTSAGLATVGVTADQLSDAVADAVAGLPIDYVNVAAYGADAAAVQEAADVAESLGGATLYFPPGTYTMNGDVVVTGCNIRCDGVLAYDLNNPATLKLVRGVTGVNLTEFGLGGLTTDSATVTGLGGLTGTLDLRSTEVLILRNNGVGQFYTKNEASRVTTSAGAITPVLDHTYDKTLLTATLYPEEAPVRVDGLTITMSGATLSPAFPFVLGVYRDNVTFNDLSIVNTTTLKPVSAVDVRGVCNIQFNTARIHGFDDTGSGYGIATYYASDIAFNDCTITRCRHAIAGRHNKRQMFRGGYYDQLIDTHWGSATSLDGVTVSTSPGNTQLSISGRDVTARRCTFIGGRNLLGLSNGTPELGGTVIIEDCTWQPSPGSPLYWAVGYSSPAQSGFDYGRTLLNPARLVIRRLDVTMPPGALPLYILQAITRNYPQTNWQDIEIDNVTTTGTGIFTAVHLDKDSPNHPGTTRGSNVVVSRMDFSAFAADSIFITNTGDTSDALNVNVTARDCKALRLKLPENGVANLLVERSDVAWLLRSATSAGTFTGNYVFDGCTFTATTFNGRFLLDLRQNKYTGALTSTILTMDARVKSSRGNLAVIGATGYPSQADGYKNPTYYI